MADHTYDVGQKFDMVFEGGGAKGMVFVGAQKALEKRQFVPARVIGTSAGAITATLLAAGYNAKMMEDAMAETDADGKPVFEGFMDAPLAGGFTEDQVNDSLTMELLDAVKMPSWLGPLEKKVDAWLIRRLMKHQAYRTLFSFVERGGIYAGNAFLEWFENKLDAAKGDVNSKMTLAEFDKATDIDLSVVASNTTKRTMMVLNHRTAPDCPVAWAVRMSMSIPFVWQEVVWKEEWGSYRNVDLKSDGTEGAKVTEDKSITNDRVVDGGALSNFPIRLLTSTDKSVQEVMGSKVGPDDYPTIGMLIDEKKPVENSGDETEAERHRKSRMIGRRTRERIKRLLNTITDAHDQAVIKAHKDRICRLPAKGYGTMDFDMSDERRAALVDAGEKAMDEFLNKLVSEATTVAHAAASGTAGS